METPPTGSDLTTINWENRPMTNKVDLIFTIMAAKFNEDEREIANEFFSAGFGMDDWEILNLYTKHFDDEWEALVYAAFKEWETRSFWETPLQFVKQTWELREYLPENFQLCKLKQLLNDAFPESAQLMELE